jgi:hypothetical protein
MDTSASGERSLDTRHRFRVFGRLQKLGNIVAWLAGLIRLTGQEEEDAGIYLGD